MICTSCGKEVPNNAIHCIACGCKISTESTRSPQSINANSTQNNHPNSTPNNYPNPTQNMYNNTMQSGNGKYKLCPRCGNYVEQIYAYCPYCSTNLVNTEYIRKSEMKREYKRIKNIFDLLTMLAVLLNLFSLISYALPFIDINGREIVSGFEILVYLREISGENSANFFGIIIPCILGGFLSGFFALIFFIVYRCFGVCISGAITFNSISICTTLIFFSLMNRFDIGLSMGSGMLICLMLWALAIILAVIGSYYNPNKLFE